MALFSKNDPAISAQQILGHFLQKPAWTIDCTLLTGGSEEDKVVRCVLQDAQYIVKLFNPEKPGINEIVWTRLASDLGIGPKLYDADSTGTHMITAVAQGASLTPVVANTPSVIQNIAKSLAKLHHSHAPFATASDSYERINAKYTRIKTSGPLHKMLESALQKSIAIKEQLSSYAKLVSCHNDLNPGNIFVESNHITLIDWGDAALSNPYYDIAAFLVLNVIDPKHEQLFLAEYDATLLNDPLNHDLQLYKQLVYFEFALNLLLGGLHAKQSPLLHAQQIPSVEHVGHYLTLLAKREVPIDENFLYSMAIASLYEMLNLHTIKGIEI